MAASFVWRGIRGLGLGMLSWLAMLLLFGAGAFRGISPIREEGGLPLSRGHKAVFGAGEAPCIPAFNSAPCLPIGCEGEDGPPRPPTDL
jgi:hypothetical protein